jgi:hypothetical protein
MYTHVVVDALSSHRDVPSVIVDDGEKAVTITRTEAVALWDVSPRQFDQMRDGGSVWRYRKDGDGDTPVILYAALQPMRGA